jgi:hypothetical protein
VRSEESASAALADYYPCQDERRAVPCPGGDSVLRGSRRPHRQCRRRRRSARARRPALSSRTHRAAPFPRSSPRLSPVHMAFSIPITTHDH